MLDNSDSPPGPSAPPFPWFDESEIEADHDEVVAQSQEAKDHLQVVRQAHQVLFSALHNHDYEGDEHAITTLRLAARVFNAAGACLKLARAGYFQPAFALVRDILEVEFLTDLFRRDRTALQQWITLDGRSRKQRFRPVRVREVLDSLDGFTEKRRAAAYEALSKHAAHVDPEGFNLISPGNMTYIGPFVSEPALIAVLQELTAHLQMTCAHLMTLLEPTHADILAAIDVFNAINEEWATRYRPALSATTSA